MVPVAVLLVRIAEIRRLRSVLDRTVIWLDDFPASDGGYVGPSTTDAGKGY
jgi:hypothetical protein